MKRKKSNCDYQKKANDQIQRPTAGVSLMRKREKQRTKSQRQRLWQHKFKNYNFSPCRLMAKLSPYQTYQRQQGWLKALNG